MKVSYEGIGQLCATFLCDGDVHEGALVEMSGNGKVRVCTTGKDFCGVAVAVAKDGTACSVQLGGFVTVRCVDEEVKAGICKLCTDAEIRVKSGGEKSYLVVSADGTTATIML